MARESLAATLDARNNLRLEDDWRALECRAAAAALDGRFGDARSTLDRLAARLGPEHPRGDLAERAPRRAGGGFQVARRRLSAGGGGA